MEFFLILLVFGISYSISASVGHYFIYAEEDAAQTASIMGYDEVQRLKIYDSAAFHAREAVLVINSRLQIVTKIGVLSDGEVESFKHAYIDDNPSNLSVLQDLFTVDATDAYLKLLPERLYFMNKKWNLKNVYDNINSVLYVYIINEENFKHMIVDIADLSGIYECTRTSVVDKIDEYLIKTRDIYISKAQNVADLKELLSRKLKMLNMHIADMDLDDTFHGLSLLIDQMLNYKCGTVEEFLTEFGEERFLAITKKDREKRVWFIEESRGSYQTLARQGRVFSEYDRYFDQDETVSRMTKDILLKIKEDHARQIVDAYVEELLAKCARYNRKLNPVIIDFKASGEDIYSLYRLLPEILPLVESELLDASQSPSERLRAGKSEYATISFAFESVPEGIRLSLTSDSNSLSDLDIREISQGRFIRSGDLIFGEVVQDEGKAVPGLGKILKSIELIGGKVEFKVNPGVSTEFTFVIPSNKV